MGVYVGMCMSTQVAEEGIISPGAGCEPLDVGSGNHTCVICRSNMHS